MTDPLTAELLRVERLLHEPPRDATRASCRALMAEDFWEVGASGRVYDIEFVLDALAERAAGGAGSRGTIDDARCRRLSPDTHALTYRLDEGFRVTRRLTLWRRGGPAGWQALYHQGTVATSTDATAAGP